eukprot:2111553-Prymnesium_polylepis.1
MLSATLLARGLCVGCAWVVRGLCVGCAWVGWLGAVGVCRDGSRGSAAAAHSRASSVADSMPVTSPL